MPRRTITEFSYRAESSGLEIAVDPYTDRNRVIRHFGMDLPSRQIIPFEILFLNRQAQGGFLLQPESAVLMDAQGLEALGSVPSDTGISRPYPATEETVTSALMMFSPLLSLPLLVVTGAAGDAYYDAQTVARNMRLASFRDRPLYPSDSNTGFVYLKLTGTDDLSKATGVAFHVKNVRSTEEKVIVVPLGRR